MAIESALTFLAAIFIFGITPGPGVFAILGRALVTGASSCFLLAFGMAVSDILYLLLACYGLAALAEHWGAFFAVVRIFGAIYLVYLGVRMWRRARHDVESVDARGRGGVSFLQGFLISAANPKVILFYIAIMPTFIDLTDLTRNDIVLAAGLTFVGLMAGLMLIAFGASSARRYVQSQRGHKTLNRLAGGIMAAAGAYLAASS